jgi:hypothetical protein
VDASGNVWAKSGCGVMEIPGGFTGNSGSPGVTINSTLQTIASPTAVAVDGANRVWLASAGANNCLGQAQPPNVSLIDSPSGYAFADPSLSNTPLFLSVDSAGNLWVLLGDNSVTEFVGVATPAVTPLAAAVKNNTLGAKP